MCSAGKPVYGGTLRVATNLEIGHIDLHLDTGVVYMGAGGHVYERGACTCAMLPGLSFSREAS